ncbi:hypothetical protein CVT26_008287, partial [Gymnopilus dilepis]
PCGGCAKKGFTAEQCTDGCEPCRRSRSRCEDGRPCRRCLEMKIDCTDESNTVAQRPLTPPVPSRPGRGERAKLACSSCRRDNKKCDDQRPCSRCVARGEECIHIARGPKLVKLRCEGCRADNKRCEDSRPCKYCVESSKQCIVVPRKGRGHGTRVKAVSPSYASISLVSNDDVFEKACTGCRQVFPSRSSELISTLRLCLIDVIRFDVMCVKKGCECIERACNTCSRDGKAGDCSHRSGQDSVTPAPKATSAQIKADGYRPVKSFQAQSFMELSSENLNSRHVPAYISGLQPHAAQPLYSNVMPFQHQHYFPPQPSGHASFPPLHGSLYSGTASDSVPLGYGYNVLNSRHPGSMSYQHPIHSNNGVFPRTN